MANLKVFKWNDLEALKQHSSGDALAIAETKEKAIKNISDLFNKENESDYYTSIREELKKELNETKPSISELKNFVFYTFGSA